MIAYLKGTINDISGDYVTVVAGPVGYEVLVSRPQEFSMGAEVEVFTSEVITQDDHYLVGFPSKFEREAFKSLVSVKGIGPKTAMTALKATTPDGLYAAIAANNTAYLKKLPGLGPKAAAQIILDLKGQLAPSSSPNEKQYDDVAAGLKALGFKKKDIDDALASINEPSASNEEILRLALRQLRKKGTK